VEATRDEMDAYKLHLKTSQ